MFDHIGLVVSDREKGWAFYERLLAPLGIKAWQKNPRPNGEGWMVMSTGAPQSPFFVVAAGQAELLVAPQPGGAEPGASVLHRAIEGCGRCVPRGRAGAGRKRQRRSRGPESAVLLCIPDRLRREQHRA